MLVCARCGSQSLVPEQEYVVGVGWVSYPKCFKCGSVKVEEREIVKSGFVVAIGKYKRPDSEVEIYPTSAQMSSSPMTVLKKEGDTMARKKCSYPGCDKRSWLKGLCHKHYTEKYGEYVPEKKGNGVVLPKAAHNKATEEFAYSVRPAESIPPIQLFLYPELLDKLTKAAKKEWRTPEGQAAYLIDKALEA